MDILVLFAIFHYFIPYICAKITFCITICLSFDMKSKKAFPYEFPSINNYYHQCLSPNLFRPDQFYLSDFPRKVVLSLYGNISQAMGLVAGNGPLRHHKTVLRNRYNRSVGIADVVFPYRRRCNDYPMSACRVVPTLAERIVIVLFDHRTVVGDDLPHAAQMIRQEIARFHSARRGHYAPATEARTFECPVIMYQRTCITSGFVVVVSAHLDLCTVGK